MLKLKHKHLWRDVVNSFSQERGEGKGKADKNKKKNKYAYLLYLLYRDLIKVPFNTTFNTILLPCFLFPCWGNIRCMFKFGFSQKKIPNK